MGQKGESTFDVTLGTYDGAGVCELIGIFMLSLLYLVKTLRRTDLPSYPHLAGLSRIFLALPHLARIFEIRLPSRIF